jgi:rRNA maturation RNase YbeY
MEAEIQFISHEIAFAPSDPEALRGWIKEVINRHKREVNCINYIFSSDSYILELNRRHLDHDYFTDILTFPYSGSTDEPIFADIFISIPRVEENATAYGVSFMEELSRVMIHGVLHLLGFNDHSEADKAEMRRQEDFALSLRGE